jgi:endonuclease/exonuclease/phosphatase family metal-dependent hydrolase
LKIISWNLLRLTGASSEDVATLIEKHCPDLVLLQEVTDDLAQLPKLVGGYFYHQPMAGRIYGLAAWSPDALQSPFALSLPVSHVPGRVPPRVAQIMRLGDVTFANVHLSHGQLLNRWQLLHIANALEGPAAIVGDYNALGPIKLPGFKDIGPRQSTHNPANVISLRLDRCMGRGLHCSHARVLARGASDHHPIALDMDLLKATDHCDAETASQTEHSFALRGFGKWLRTIADPPNPILVRKTLRSPPLISKHPKAGPPPIPPGKQRIKTEAFKSTLHSSDRLSNRKLLPR